MRISLGTRILPSFIFVFLLSPHLSWGDCFGPTITKLNHSTKAIQAKVIANKKLSANSCRLTLFISGTKITGEAQSRLCRAKKNDTVSIKIKTRCCDTQPCKKGQQNKILFIPWTPPLKAHLFSLGSTKSTAAKSSQPTVKTSKPQAIKKARPKPTAKPSKPITGNGVAKNTINVAPAENVAIGKGTTSVTTKTLADSGVAGTAGIVLNNGGTGQKSTLASSSAAAENGQNDLDNYKVELGVDEAIFKPGPPGQLKVWIGDPSLSAGFTEDMATAETTIAALAPFARVTPEAPDFEVKPKQSICVKIDPSGSEVHFAITPKHTGTFNVGASVLLYETDTCTGAPVPKSAADLEVKVKVNPQGLIKYYLLQLWDVLWKGVLNFWGWLVATIFGLFVFLIRKKLKKRFGYDAPDAGSADN